MYKKNCPHCGWLKSDRETFIPRKNRGGAVYDSHKMICRSFNVLSDTHDSSLQPKTLYSALSFAHDLMIDGRIFNEDGGDRYIVPVNKLYISAFNNEKKRREHPHLMLTISRSYGDFNLKRVFMDPDMADMSESNDMKGEDRGLVEKNPKLARSKGINFCKTRGLIPYENETQIHLNGNDILFLANTNYEEYVDFIREKFREKGVSFNIDNTPYFMVLTLEKNHSKGIDMSGIISA